MKENIIEIPFGAFDSELGGFEYTIPEGFNAEIKDGKVIVRKAESEDEKIRKEIIDYIKNSTCQVGDKTYESWIAWLEKQGYQSPIQYLKYRVGDIIRYRDKECTVIGIDVDNHCYDLTDDECLDFDTADDFELVEKKSVEDIVKEITKDKESAIKFLKSAGIMDSNGELAKEYRNEQNPLDGTENVDNLHNYLYGKKEWSEGEESEDEKIRKAIYLYIDSGHPFMYHNVKSFDMLAWLEKQGKQKPVELNENVQKLVELVTQRMLREGPIPTLKGQQKADFENTFNKFKQIAGLINWPARIEIYKNIILWFIAWGKEHLPKLGDDIENTDNIDKEQKNNEWSEEDERMITAIVADLSFLEQEMKATGSFDRDREKNWLKSFKERHTWKPSEEQMNALDSTLQYSQVSHNSYEYLNSLYNDLKKL